MMDFTKPKWSCQCAYNIVEDAISSRMPAGPTLKNNMDPRSRTLDRKQRITAEHQAADFETCNASTMMHLDSSTPNPSSATQTSSHRGHPRRSCTPRKGTIEAQSAQGESLLINNSNKLKFNSCRFERSITGDCKARVIGSSSFRSASSGYWESGPDKDIAESSSSSRDSNGSSMDSTYLPDTNTEASSSSTSSLSSSSSSVVSPPHRRTAATHKNFLPWKSLFHHLVIRAPKWQGVGRKTNFNSDGGMQRLRGPLMGKRNVGKRTHRSEDSKRRSIVGSEDGGKSSREGGNDENKGTLRFEDGGKGKITAGFGERKSRENVDNGNGQVQVNDKSKSKKWYLGSRQSGEEKNLSTKKRCGLPKDHHIIELDCKQQQHHTNCGGDVKKRIYARSINEALIKLDECGRNEMQSNGMTVTRQPWPLSHVHCVMKKQGNFHHHHYRLHDLLPYPSHAHHSMNSTLVARSHCRKDPIPFQSTSHYGSLSTMQELHCSLQSAIAHCKQSNSQHS